MLEGTLTPGGLAQNYLLEYTRHNLSGLAWADFDGDGYADLAVVVGGDVNILLGSFEGHLGNPVAFPVASAPKALAVADFNGDGHLDILAGPDPLVVLEGRGDGTFAPPLPLVSPVPFSFMAVADFNGDGLPDVAGAAPGSPDATVDVLLNVGCQGPPGSPDAGPDAPEDAPADAK